LRLAEASAANQHPIDVVKILIIEISGPIPAEVILYRQRNLAERFFNKIKHYRRIATRYDKLNENYLAALKLVAVRICLKDL
jgi:hypothetical protein